LNARIRKRRKPILYLSGDVNVESINYTMGFTQPKYRSDSAKVLTAPLEVIRDNQKE